MTGRWQRLTGWFATPTTARTVIAVLLVFVVIGGFGVQHRQLRALEAQLTTVTDSLLRAKVSTDSARAIAVAMAAARQAQRDSVLIERTLRDSLYRVAEARRVEARKWRAVAASLPVRSVVDTLPLIEQVTIYRDEVERLRAAGDVTALALEDASATIAALQDSDARERARADLADARAATAEAALAAQLEASRQAIRASLAAARRPWYKKWGGAMKSAGSTAVVATIAYFAGQASR